jgi:hypothetical protein
MQVAFNIPDDLASRVNASGNDLPRRALEAFALEEYKSGHITSEDLRRMLGYTTAINSMASSRIMAFSTTTPWLISTASRKP